MTTKVDGLAVDDEVAKLVKLAEGQGWTVTATRNRLRFCSPVSDAPPVFVPTKTPGGKDLRAVLAMLHRAGLDDMPGGNARYQDEPEPAEGSRVLGTATPSPDMSPLDWLMVSFRVSVEELLRTSGDDASQWQQLAEDAERRLAEVEAERDSAVARAEKAEGEITGMRQAMRQLMGDG